MENKDWRGDLLKIGEIPDGSEETTFVEFHLDTLNDFINKVVEEAREEGYQDCMDEQLSKAREEVLGEVLSKGRDLSVLHLAPHIPVSDVEEILSKLRQ